MCLYPTSIAVLTDSYAVPFGVYHERGETLDFFFIAEIITKLYLAVLPCGDHYTCPVQWEAFCFHRSAGWSDPQLLIPWPSRVWAPECAALLVGAVENVTLLFYRWNSSQVQRVPSPSPSPKSQKNVGQKDSKLLKTNKKYLLNLLYLITC